MTPKSGPKTYTTAEIARVVEMIEATRGHDGKVNIKSVVRSAGVNWRTARKWWEAHLDRLARIEAGEDMTPPKPLAPLHVLRRPNPATPEDQEADSSTVQVDSIDIQATPELGYHAWQFGQIAIDIAGARDSRSYGALAPLRRQMDEHYLAARKLIEAETAKTGRSAAEVMAHLKATAEKMAPGQIAIFIDEAKRRRMV